MKEKFIIPEKNTLKLFKKLIICITYFEDRMQSSPATKKF